MLEIWQPVCLYLLMAELIANCENWCTVSPDFFRKLNFNFVTATEVDIGALLRVIFSG